MTVGESDTIAVVGAEVVFETPWRARVAAVAEFAAGAGFVTVAFLAGDRVGLFFGAVGAGFLVWAIATLRSDGERRSAARSVAARSRPIALHVVDRSWSTVPGSDTQVVFAVPGAPPGAKARPWRFDARDGAPAYLDEHCEWIAGLAAVAQPDRVVPLTEIGRPLRLAPETLDRVFEECSEQAAPPRTLDVPRRRLARDRVDLPAARHDARTAGFVILAFFGTLSGIATWWALANDAVIPSIPFGVLLVLVLWFAHRMPLRVTVDETGVRVVRLVGARAVSWADLRTVIVVGHLEEGGDGVAALIRVARALFLALEDEDPFEPPTLGYDEIWLRLRSAGLGFPEATPRTALERKDGRTIRLGAGLDWRCAHHLAHAAAVRGIDVAIG